MFTVALADLDTIIEDENALKRQFSQQQQAYGNQKAALKLAETESRQKQQHLARVHHSAQTRCLRWAHAKQLVVAGFFRCNHC